MVLAAMLAGCGEHHDQANTALRLERLPDTSGMTRGAPLLTHLEPYRMSNGLLRVRGTLNVPDGVRLQITIYRKDPPQMIGRVQVITTHQRFDSPPILVNGAPPPPGAYRFECLALFNAAWQDPGVLWSTHNGLDLHGPGVTRDRTGGAAFFIAEERSL